MHRSGSRARGFLLVPLVGLNDRITTPRDVALGALARCVEGAGECGVLAQPDMALAAVGWVGLLEVALNGVTVDSRDAS